MVTGLIDRDSHFVRQQLIGFCSSEKTRLSGASGTLRQARKDGAEQARIVGSWGVALNGPGTGTAIEESSGLNCLKAYSSDRLSRSTY